MPNLNALRILHSLNPSIKLPLSPQPSPSLTGAVQSKPSDIRYVTYRGTQPGPVRLRDATVSVAIESTTVTMLVGSTQVQIDRTTLTAALYRSLAQVGSSAAGGLTIARPPRGPLSLRVDGPRGPRVWLPREAVASLAGLLSP